MFIAHKYNVDEVKKQGYSSISKMVKEKLEEGETVSVEHVAYYYGFKKGNSEDSNQLAKIRAQQVITSARKSLENKTLKEARPQLQIVSNGNYKLVGVKEMGDEHVEHAKRRERIASHTESYKRTIKAILEQDPKQFDFAKMSLLELTEQVNTMEKELLSKRLGLTPEPKQIKNPKVKKVATKEKTKTTNPIGITKILEWLKKGHTHKFVAKRLNTTPQQVSRIVKSYNITPTETKINSGKGRKPNGNN